MLGDLWQHAIVLGAVGAAIGYLWRRRRERRSVCVQCPVSPDRLAQLRATNRALHASRSEQRP